METPAFTVPECEAALARALAQRSITDVARRTDLPEVVVRTWTENPRRASDEPTCRNTAVLAKVERFPPPERLLYGVRFFRVQPWIQRLVHVHECIHLLADLQHPESVQHAPRIVEIFWEELALPLDAEFRVCRELAALPLEVAVERCLLTLLPDDELRWVQTDIGAFTNGLPARPDQLNLVGVLTCAYLASRVRFILEVETAPAGASRTECRELAQHLRGVAVSGCSRWGTAVAETLGTLLAVPTLEAYLPAARALVSTLLARRTGRTVRWSVE